ncbi:restriction endonuclease [Clostridium botulinum]|uniref:Restriction endonuclease family protein n=2 Tax=Clostridium botulinum TaxID=1491 RepID=A0A126JIB8_CLOBO|nr:restriction endonuclease [Clostridium botulinum]ALT05436.1 restriction endonuclease family protein [Clostridium botulinum]ALT05534.1 restriction endonuclease family protein [Clostridium botulinum]MBY6811010.1 restriction endonuclease [Clostridium botulinum]MBY6818487.1 restriction endonuclease [Clostridium botulinum]MBY6824478.1 restriction endonuclease [Clostridium botulinum]
MNGYDEFFSNMNDEEWENFAVDVLTRVGFEILTFPSFGADGGKDFLVEYNGIKYIVSCKHYINSGHHVGVKDESDIIDRIVQHQANGFIGFYSTGITSKLQERLDGIKANTKYNYIIFYKNMISIIIPKMDSKVLFNYGKLKLLYYMNVSKEDYKPLKCTCCKKDILNDKRIAKSLAGLVEYQDGTIGFIYGCKRCLMNIKFYLGIYLELEQALHIKQLISWDDFIDDTINEDNIILSENFYKRKNTFEKRIRQRSYPQNYGTWYEI